MAEFVADTPGGKSWHLASPLTLPHGESDFFVTVDLTATPHANATCQFFVDMGGMTFENNPGFRLPAPYVSQVAQPIQLVEGAAAQAELKGGMVVFPQPGKGKIHFTYDLDSPAQVNLKIFDRNGSLVSEITDPGKPAGRAVTDWDASEVAAGVYYSVLKIAPDNGGSEKVFKKKVVVER